ncbi:unnamed protein product [Aphanomyces euteiches]
MLRNPAPNERRPPPESGVVAVPWYDFNDRFFKATGETFLSSLPAIQALLDVKKYCNNISNLSLMKTEQAVDTLDGIRTPKSVTMADFVAAQSQTNQNAVRYLRDNWTRAAAKAIQSHMGSTSLYNLLENHRNLYEATQLQCILRRINFMAQDSLRDLIQSSFTAYTSFIENVSLHKVVIKDTNDVDVKCVEDAGTKVSNYVPLFKADVIVSSDVKVLNQAEIDARQGQIKDWMTENKEEGEKCPLEPINPIEGHVFEYSTAPSSFIEAASSQFETVLTRVKSLELIERLVMDRLFWPQQDCIQSVELQENWMQLLLSRVNESLARALAPMDEYLQIVNKYVSLLNLNVADYLSSLIKSPNEKSKDDDSNSGDIDVTPPMELNELRRAIQKHREAERAILDCIPSQPINLGIVLVDLSNIRMILSKKHNEIYTKLLETQVSYCYRLSTKLTGNFEEINANLAVTPKDVEGLTQLQEYISSVPTVIQPLQEEIRQMLNNNDLVDEFQFIVSDDHLRLKWNVLGWPNRIATQSSRFKWALEERKVKFAKQMEAEQDRFEKTLTSLTEEVDAFSRYDNLSHVEDIAHHAMSVQKKLDQATADAALFNSRETLFGKEITSYDMLAVAKKNFEPYNLLWSSSYNWIQSRKQWTQCSFTDVNAEEIEKSVELYGTSIQKASKFFANSGNDACAKIADTIKEQINVFKPYKSWYAPAPLE